MGERHHQRHKPPRALAAPRNLVVVCAPLRSNINLSRIARTAGCCGITRLISIGTARIDPKIARDAAEHITLETHRTLSPVVDRLGAEGYRLVGLEQTNDSKNIHQYPFESKTALVVGNERLGLEEDILAKLDDIVEIPVWGLPFSYNVATATAMALYEYCRQFPEG